MKLREKINIFKKEVFALFPDAITELDYENDFQLLVAIIMSAQTTDKQVNKVNKTFFKELKTPEDGIKLGEEKIRNYIKSVSFFNNKARNILTTCEILTSSQSSPSKEKEFNSLLPQGRGVKDEGLDSYDTVEKLTLLAGVGIKTAKVFLAVTKNAPFLAVDTHVHRVLNRVGIVKTKTPEQTDKRAEKILTTDDLAQLHHSLIMFGRYHCIARKPKCESCKLQNICNYYKKNTK